MRFLILLMLSLGLTSEWGTSVSVRTPNDETKPLDYELSIKLNDTNGKLRYLLKREKLMESKSFVKLLRKIIREEVSRAVKQTLTESNINQVTTSMNLSEITDDPMPNRPVAKKKKFTKNQMLNDILNETAATAPTQEMTDWSTMNFKSEMAEAFGLESEKTLKATTDLAAFCIFSLVLRASANLLKCLTTSVTSDVSIFLSNISFNKFFIFYKI